MKGKWSVSSKYISECDPCLGNKSAQIRLSLRNVKRVL